MIGIKANTRAKSIPGWRIISSEDKMWKGTSYIQLVKIRYILFQGIMCKTWLGGGEAGEAKYNGVKKNKECILSPKKGWFWQLKVTWLILYFNKITDKESEIG